MVLEGMVVHINFIYMRFLEYLYYKFYRFQVWMGNDDIAVFTAALMIAFISVLYYFAVFFMKIIFIPDIFLIPDSLFMFFSIIILIGFLVILYMKFFYKNRYKKVIEDNRLKESNNLLAILFPLIAFILLVSGMFIKMLQNQGKL